MKKKIYLTQDGLKKLQDELEELKNVKRAEIIERIKEAKSHGDLSENAEYENAKNMQSFVEGRISELEHMLAEVNVIENSAATGEVLVGSKVKVALNGGHEEYTIVGSQEADPTQGFISNESPIGQALLGKKIGESVNVQVPAGEIEYKIISIS